MKINEALKILGLTEGTHTAEAIKTAYKKASIKYHPDRNPAGAEMMKSVNAAYDLLKTMGSATGTSEEGETWSDLGDELNEILNELAAMAGLVIEVCGCWVWISGDTMQHKDAIKALGCMWASKKKMWYFRPAGQRSKKRGGSWDMDKIRDSYGSGLYTGRKAYRTALNAA